ncbi:MAG: sensor signal transduction histidine kinase [Marmoricola sp.]|nr:sensor signal transduction histidine kinase [Marmoricola sp.]
MSLLVGALVVAAYLSGVGALAVGRATGSTAAWWPAAGIGVVAVLLAPRRQWPIVLGALALAFTLANLTLGRSVLVSVLLGLSDVAETTVVALLVVRYIGRRLDDVMDVWKLFAIATAGALVAATGVSLVYHALLGTAFWSTLGLTLPSHAASVVLLAPIALLSTKSQRRLRPSRGVELLAQMTVLLTATLITFEAAQVTLGFAPLPVIVWAAVRFSEWVVVLEQIAYATAVTLFTQYGTGPFSLLAAADAGNSTRHAQLYLICLVLIGLPLCKAMRQHDEALTKVLASERTFRRNFTESRVPVAILSREDGELYFAECNDATVDLLGQSSSDLARQPVTELLSSSDLAYAAGQIVHGEAAGWTGPIGVTADPRTRLDGTLSLIEELEDSAIFSLHLVDVTEPQEMQERLQAERNYTRAVIDTASSMIVLTRLDGTVIAANPATTTLLGFTEDELLGRPMWERLISRGQQQAIADIFAQRRLPRTGETQLLTKDGQQRAVIFSSAIHRATADAPVTVVISATDVTAARQNAGMVNHLLRSATTIAFVGTDLAGRITLFNTGAEHMLGVDADTATGCELVEFIGSEDLARYASSTDGRTTFEAIVDHSAGDLAPETRDWTWLPAGRPPLKVSMTTNPVTDTFGDLFGYLFVASDITDTRRSQEILVRALHRERDVVSRLKDLDNVKDDFVTTVSHELRTPMSSIIGSAEMLADGMVGELAPAQLKMVEVISRNGDRLLALADNLLLLATFDHTSWHEQTTDVDMRKVVEESASAIASMLATRDLDIRFTLPTEPVLVSGDPSHLERALTNLLTNAVKFTPDGGHVHVEVHADAESSAAVLSVTDTGLGIPDSDLDQVFGRFFRSSVVQEQAIQGSGLGLAIVKTIVESHAGRIDVRSEPGTGSTFTVTLPLVKAAVAAR